MSDIMVIPGVSNLLFTTGSLSSDQNTISGATSYGRIRLVLGANININSLPAGYDGQEIELVNTSSTYTATLVHQSGSGTNKLFTLTDALNVVARPLSSIKVKFDSTTDTWRQAASAQLERAVPITFLASNSVALVIAAAQTALPAHHYTFSDLTNYKQFRLVEGHSSGTNSGTKYGVQYSLDSGSTWTWLDGTSSASAPTAYVDITTATVLNISVGWNTIDVAAKTEVQLRPVFLDGANVSHNLRNVCVVVR